MTAFQILCFCSAVKRHRPGVNLAQSVDYACSAGYRAKSKVGRLRLLAEGTLFRSLSCPYVVRSGTDYSPEHSVNSRGSGNSKCPIWCRLREIGSHFYFLL